jgi:hypothetical protein
MSTMSKARRMLEVTIMFEPTRLAAEHLADAYAQVVPLRQRACRLLAPSSEVVSEPQGVASVRRVRS